MTEAQLYDKDGLFHNIVKQSAIMSGRYHVLPNPNQDLNSNSISGIELPTDKYPLVGCLTPISFLNPTLQKGQWEPFSFRLLFLCSSEQTGDHQLKVRDPYTNTSMHRIVQDWQEMKSVALSFMNALELIQEKNRGQFILDDRGQWRINRIIKVGNDQTTGILLAFNLSIAAPCEFEDIPPSKIATVVFPTAQHQKHFH